MGTEHTVPPTIVIVEDTPPILAALRHILTRAGYDVQVSPFGHAAVDFIRSTQPALLMLDVGLPALNGIAIFRIVRSDPQIEAIPVIFITANPEAVIEQIPDYASRNAALVAKPFDLAGLRTTVATMLK